MKKILFVFFQNLLVLSVDAFVFPVADPDNATITFDGGALFARDTDVSDFGWVKRWAAVGDSFTAGIGSGTPLGNPIKDQPEDTNWYCSRYDTAYPMIINDALGPSVTNFQFMACSGDRTGGIYNQIKRMEGDLDLVVLTAGGNDLCLVCSKSTLRFVLHHAYLIE